MQEVKTPKRREDDTTAIVEGFCKGEVHDGEFEFDFAIGVAAAFDETAMFKFDFA